jgi:hypothetical protein
MKNYEFNNIFINSEIISEVTTNKLFTFVYEDKRIEQTCVHVDELHELDSFDSSIRFKNETNAEAIPDKSQWKRLILRTPSKTYDISIHPELFEVILVYCNLTYTVAEKLHATPREPFMLLVSDVHGNLIQMLTPLVYLGMYDIVLTECTSDRIEVSFRPTGSVSKCSLIYIGDFINPGVPKVVGYNKPLLCFCDDVVVNLVKYESKLMLQEIRDGIIKAHPLFLTGNHDTWIDDYNQVIYDMHAMWDDDILYIRHTFFSDYLVEHCRGKVKLYDLYSYERCNVKIGPLTFTLFVSRQPAGVINFVQSCVESTKLTHINTVDDMNTVIEIIKGITPTSIKTAVNELTTKPPKNTIFICGHDSIYPVIQNVMLGVSAIENDENIALTGFKCEPISSFNSHTNVHQMACVQRKLYAFDDNVYLVCCDILRSGIGHKFLNHSYSDTLNFHKIQKIIHDSPEKCMHYGFDGLSLENLSDKPTKLYKRYLRAYMKTWQELENSSEFDVLVKEIFADYIESSIRADSFYHYKDNAKKVDDLSNTDLRTYFDFITKRFAEQMIDYNDSVIQKWWYRAGILSGDRYDFDKNILRYPIANLSVIYGKRNAMSTIYAVRYGGLKLIFDLKTLMRLFDVYVYLFDSGRYISSIPMFHYNDLPLHITNDIIFKVFANKKKMNEAMKRLYKDGYSDDVVDTLMKNFAPHRLKLTEELLEDTERLKYELFRLHILQYGIFETKAHNLGCFESLAELFEDSTITPLDKLHRMRNYLPYCFQYYEYNFDYTSEARNYLNHAEVLHKEPPQHGEMFTIEQVQQCISESMTYSSDAIKEHLLDIVSKYPAKDNYKNYTWRIYQDLLNNNTYKALAEICGGYYKAKREMYATLTEFSTKLLTDNNVQLTFKQLHEQDVDRFNQILLESSKKMISSIYTYYSNDDSLWILGAKDFTTLFKHKLEHDYNEFDFYYYKLGEEHITPYPAFYSLFWYKTLYADIPDKIRYTLNGGNVEQKQRSFAKIFTVISLVVFVVLVLVITLLREPLPPLLQRLPLLHPLHPLLSL